jgi:hypothetical protein
MRGELLFSFWPSWLILWERPYSTPFQFSNTALFAARCPCPLPLPRSRTTSTKIFQSRSRESAQSSQPSGPALLRLRRQNAATKDFFMFSSSAERLFAPTSFPRRQLGAILRARERCSSRLSFKYFESFKKVRPIPHLQALPGGRRQWPSALGTSFIGFAA